MTIRIPSKNFLDNILNLIGKKRAVFISGQATEKFGIHSTVKPQKESFIKAFISSRDRKLPDGWVYLEDLKKVEN